MAQIDLTKSEAESILYWLNYHAAALTRLIQKAPGVHTDRLTDLLAVRHALIARLEALDHDKEAPPTPEEFADTMETFAETEGRKPLHTVDTMYHMADDLLCRILRELGYDEAIDIYDGIENAYA